jgi:hypothetical protein
MTTKTNKEKQQLTEAQQYYIGLFERWQKMSRDEKVKEDNIELWEELQKIHWNEFNTLE